MYNLHLAKISLKLMCEKSFLCVTLGRCVMTLGDSDRDGPDSKSAIIIKEVAQRQKMFS